ncbi:putative Zn(2)-C6 fungal-type domain-containing protein [Seiridium cardinale]|uniref:Zn(2)-C6 fungal-type domain-containing protein n=1 Tax=Seiridium cardinale TaxID=138064 RepID=A0ABR2XTV1_9PEZI
MTTTVEASQAGPKTKPAGKVRKRAAKACLSCRARKVRCDVSQRGRPCMNCYLDSETCVVTGRASRFRRPDRPEENVQASHPPYDPDHVDCPRTAEDILRSRLNGELASPPTSQDGTTRQDGQQVPCDGYAHDDALDSHEEDRQTPIIHPTSANTNVQNITQNSIPQPIFHDHTPHMAPDMSSFLVSEQPLWVGDQRVQVNADITYSYYPFLTLDNLPNVMPQDVNYLESQGCFRVPTREILDEFVQQYFLHVHPVMPMLNEGDFWDMYGESGHGGSGERMSLLVFQSMLFSSVNFVPKSSINALGFPSIRIARAAIYRRCKLLYDLDSEVSMVSLAQAALLLSHWSPNFTHAFKKANSAWLGIAIQNAKSAEAHLYSAMPTYSATASPAQNKKQNVLKRLWWCCILRDRILPLGLRRSLKITRYHFDFDANPGFGYTDLADEIDRSRVYNSGTKRCLIEIFVQLVELGTVLTDLLMLVFPLDDSPGWGKQGGPEDAEKVRQCKGALRRWYKGATLRFPMFGGDAVPRMTVSGGKDFQHDSVILYTNLMYMYYHSARVVLSHHEVLHTALAAATPNLTNSLREFSNIYENRHELQDAASGVTECLKELIQLRLARWLPIPAVACTALPLVLHIIDVKLSTYNKNTTSVISSSQQAVKQHRLNILIEAMKTYQPQYDGVDYVSETIRHIVTLAQLDTPAPPAVSNPIKDWQDILASQPGCYLRLAMTMDLSLSKGRLPEESDFPASLRGLFTAGYSSVKALMEAGKTNLGPQQNMFTNPADDMFLPTTVPAAPGTIHSLPSDSDTDSPQSLDDQTTSNRAAAPGNDQRRQVGHDQDLHMTDHSFIDASGEMEDLAGDVLAAYAMQNGSPQSSSSYTDGDGTIVDDDGTMTDWIDHAYFDSGSTEQGDQETAQALLDALRGGDGIGIECGA